MLRSLVGSEMCIRDRLGDCGLVATTTATATTTIAAAQLGDCGLVATTTATATTTAAAAQLGDCGLVATTTATATTTVAAAQRLGGWQPQPVTTATGQQLELAAITTGTRAVQTGILLLLV